MSFPVQVFVLMPLLLHTLTMEEGVFECVCGGGGGDKSFSDLKLSSRHSLFAMHFMPKQSLPTSFAIALTMFNGCE